MGKTQTWQTAVQTVMKQATEQEKTRRYEGIASFNYRWEHVQAVVKLALKLADLTGADRDIIEAAAWLHDIRKDAGDFHPREGATFARQFLPTTNFPKEKIEAVARAIEDHMGLFLEKPLTNLESAVLWDADKLTKIGLTGGLHRLAGKLAGSKERTMKGLMQKELQNDWLSKTVASMHTEPAKQAAQARLESYQQLWQILEQELEGNDLSDVAFDRTASK